MITLIGIAIGVIIAISTMIVSKKWQPENEKRFYSLSVIPIAVIYAGFSYYYGDLTALHAETIGIIIFIALALLGQLMTSSFIVFAYIGHGLWDLLHEIFQPGIVEAIPWTQVPLGYAAFCLTYDLIVAVYVSQRKQRWAADTDMVRY